MTIAQSGYSNLLSRERFENFGDFVLEDNNK